MSSPEQLAPAANIETMTVDELTDWLEDQGIPEASAQRLQVSYFL